MNQGLKTVIGALLCFIMTLAPVSATASVSNIAVNPPSAAQMIKTIRVAGGVSAVAYAIEMLFDGIDWVMDPANNQIIYKSNQIEMPNGSYLNPNDYVYSAYHPVIGDYLAYPTPEKACRHHIYNTYGNPTYRYSGYVFAKDGGVGLSCLFKVADSDYESSIGWMPMQQKPEQLNLSFESIAKQIISNAKEGHQASIDFLSMAKSDSNEEADTHANTADTASKADDEQSADGADKHTLPKRTIKTGNSDLDDIFKDAYPTDDGNRGYHLPDITQAELVDRVAQIEGAEIVSHSGGFIINLPDGKWINTYPARSSTQNPGWEIHMKPKDLKSKPKYKGDTER